ncbi:unnamed protein product [Knipowitschia caucasica]|uniref:Proline-rich protein PRCC n=1 Tax=Knipowitschia caucasica TaxID=637954 RepID=A0AAV2K4I0_KNICA
MSLVAYGSSDESDSEETSSPPQSKGLFSVLPAPKKKTSAIKANALPKQKQSIPSDKSAADDGSISQSKGSLFASLPKPKKRNEPVRISAPQIQKRDSDSDEEEPARKKKVKVAGGTGLSSLLPQPRNMSVRDTERPLIPYTLTKRQEPKVAKPSAPSALLSSSASPSAIKAAAKSAAMQLARQIASDDHDEEEIGPGNYFSLENNSQPAPAAEVVAESKPVIDPVQFGAEGPGPSNAPLTFGANAEEGGAWGGQYRTDPETYSQEYYNQPYYEDPNAEQDPNVQGVQGDQETVEAEEPGNSAMFDEEAFMRLQGKRNRGKEEITFLEIKGDDQLSGTQQWLTKAITEEQTRSSFSKKRGGMPTGQQRRKHQITYLIHQAKEREIELKNTWAENKLTRRQTQAKYGF